MHFRLPQNILDAFVFSVICLWSVILMPDVNRACVKWILAQFILILKCFFILKCYILLPSIVLYLAIFECKNLLIKVWIRVIWIQNQPNYSGTPFSQLVI